MSISQTQQLSFDPTINLIVSLFSRLKPVEKTLVKKYLEKNAPWNTRLAKTLSYFREKTAGGDENKIISDVLETITEVRREKKSGS